MNNHELAAALVRDIFERFSEPEDKIHRIAFIGGTWPDEETDLGGLCETALVTAVSVALDRTLQTGDTLCSECGYESGAGTPGCQQCESTKDSQPKCGRCLGYGKVDCGDPSNGLIDCPECAGTEKDSD